MSVRVAFDIDGVLADMEGALRRLAGVSARPALESTQADHATDEAPRELTAAERRHVWRSVRRTHNFWDTLDELEPGALVRLRALSRDRRWHVLFLTQRTKTAGDAPQLQTQRWLERHGFEYPSVLVVSGMRGKLASALALDFVVDDVPDYCLDVKIESRARSCLIWRHDHATLPPAARRLGIEVFQSFNACLDYLQAADTVVKTPRFMDTLRQRFGLKVRAPLDLVEIKFNST